MRVYNSTKEALKIIGDVSRGTFLEQAPVSTSASIIELEDLGSNNKEYANFFVK